jgi:hypothetical protein
MMALKNLFKNPNESNPQTLLFRLYKISDILVDFDWESKGRSGSIGRSIKWNQYEYVG